MAVSKTSLTPLSGVGDMTANWLEWKNQFVEYLKINSYTAKSEDLKIHLLKENIGQHGLHAIDAINKNYNEKALNNLEILLEKLNIFFKVPKSEVVERYNFFTQSLKKGQSIDNYILELKEKAETCKFESLTDSLIRDKVITDIKDKQLVSKLLKTEDLNLIKLMSICHDYDKLKQAQIEASKKNVNLIKSNTDNETKTSPKNDNSNIKKIDNQNCETKPMEFKRNCRKCNQRHKLKACPAWGYKCEKCGERHHFTHCCPMNILNINEREINPVPGISNRNINHQNNASKPSFGIPNNMRGAYMGPSAPPISEIDNTLYPNLNDYKKPAKNVFTDKSKY
ncbi:uncharacterized protein LOC117229340 isoform X2 [Megalopta genalis]|uniref:uncharacterized protein LOC117229340 isoform X2 n=1 Tax=Megalopta genalis TaxID=115081 RepID=UPI003FD3DFF4